MSTRVGILATPDTMASPVSALFETFQAVNGMVVPGEDLGTGEDPFEPEIVGRFTGEMESASGLPITVQRSVDEVDAIDLVVIPSMQMTEDGDWLPDRYPRIVAWLRDMHADGATICAACSGGMLVAETGLLDGYDATVHWVSEAAFRRRHPEVTLRIEETLVVSGEGGRLVTSGAATAWHDLALYLIARYVGPATAGALGRFYLLQWHRDGQAPFSVFDPRTDHGDAAVATAQRWIATNLAVANPVEEMAARSGLAGRTFKRRFKAATGETPIAYVQALRVERAKRLLEADSEPIEEIAWAVGYEDPASFRRLFKRLTGITAGEYRRRFRLPELPHVGSGAAS